MSFAAHYRAIVGPRLRQMCRYGGLKVSLNEARFGEITAGALAEAWRLGAGYLPPDVRDELPDQIADWVMDAIEAADASCAMVDEVAADIARCLAHLPVAAPLWPDRAMP